MTAHIHQVIISGCYRCDLNLDEVAAAEREESEQMAREAACPGHEWRSFTSRFQAWRKCVLCGKEDE